MATNQDVTDVEKLWNLEILLLVEFILVEIRNIIVKTVGKAYSLTHKKGDLYRLG